MHNPTNKAYTVTLPKEADVNHQGWHKIVNTAYMKLSFGSGNFFHQNLEKIWFNDQVQLPAKSTYAIFMDITDMQQYTGQWDVAAFLTLSVSDGRESKSLPIEGILARDAYNEVPEKLPAARPDGPALQTVSFCRDYDPETRKVNISFRLIDNTHDPILLELPTSLKINGVNQNLPITLKGAVCKDDQQCGNRITDGKYFKLKAGESVDFKCEVKLEFTPAEDFAIRTSLRYNYNGQTLVPYLIGENNSMSCDALLPINQRPTETAAPSDPDPVVTSTPAAPELEPLETLSFCRDYDAAARKLRFSYSLFNNSAAVIPVELPRTMAVEGLSGTVRIGKVTCTSDGISCTSRIENGKLNLFPNETVFISGEAELKSAPAKPDFYIQTSLRYDHNDTKLIAFFLGRTSGTCSASPVETIEPTKTTEPVRPTATAVPTTPVVTAEPESSALRSAGFCKTGYNANAKTVSFRYTLENTSSGRIAVELATSIAVQGQQGTAPVRYLNCVSGNASCLGKIKNGYLYLEAGTSAELTGEARLSANPVNNFTIRTSLRYKLNGDKLIPFYIGTTAETCSGGKAAGDIKNPYTLTYKVTNDLADDLTVTAGPLSFAGGTVKEYLGSAVYISARGEVSSSRSVIFTNGESFVLPPNTSAEVTIVFLSEQPAAEINEANVRWNYTQQAGEQDLPVQTGAKSVTLPETSRRGDDRLTFYQTGDFRIPQVLPATGFSAHGPAVLSVQPESLAYGSLNGMQLDIPSIGVSAEIVRVPLNEQGEWAVDWLASRAGILEDSPLPGEGISVIAAHNHLDEMNAGPFAALSLLSKDDRIFVTDAEGNLQIFIVYESTLLDPDDGEMIYRKAVPGALVLLTCESELPEGGYAYRRAVFAEQIQ